MIDILTYAIARRKSAAKLDELYSQTKAVADAAKDSAETSKAAAETSKDLLNKTTAELRPSRLRQALLLQAMHLARTRAAGCRFSSRKAPKRGYKKWVTHGNLSIIL